MSKTKKVSKAPKAKPKKAPKARPKEAPKTKKDVPSQVVRCQMSHVERQKIGVPNIQVLNHPAVPFETVVRWIDDFIFRFFMMAPHLKNATLVGGALSTVPVNPIQLRVAWYTAYLNYCIRAETLSGSAGSVLCPNSLNFPVPHGLAKLFQYSSPYRDPLTGARYIPHVEPLVDLNVEMGFTQSLNNSTPSPYPLNATLDRAIVVLTNQRTDGNQDLEFAGDQGNSKYTSPNNTMTLIDAYSSLPLNVARQVAAVFPCTTMEQVPLYAPDGSALGKYLRSTNQGFAAISPVPDFDPEMVVIIATGPSNVTDLNNTPYIYDKPLPVARGYSPTSEVGNYNMTLLQSYVYLTVHCKNFHPGCAHMLLKSCSLATNIKSFSFRSRPVDVNHLINMLCDETASLNSSETSPSFTNIWIVGLRLWIMFITKVIRTDSIIYSGVRSRYWNFSTAPDYSLMRGPAVPVKAIDQIGIAVVDGNVYYPTFNSSTFWETSYLRGLLTGTNVYTPVADGLYQMGMLPYGATTFTLDFGGVTIDYELDYQNYSLLPTRTFEYLVTQQESRVGDTFNSASWSLMSFRALGSTSMFVNMETQLSTYTLSARNPSANTFQTPTFYQSKVLKTISAGGLLPMSNMDLAAAYLMPITFGVGGDAGIFPYGGMARGKLVSRGELNTIVNKGDLDHNTVEFGNLVMKDMPKQSSSGFMLKNRNRENVYEETIGQMLLQPITSFANALHSGAYERTRNIVKEVSDDLVARGKDYGARVGSKFMDNLMNAGVSYVLSSYVGKTSYARIPSVQLRDQASVRLLN